MEANFLKTWSEKNLGPHAEHSDKVAPFKTNIFSNFLDKQTFDKIRTDVASVVKLKPKDNDLYKFKQSRDLKTQTPAKRLTKDLHEFIDLMLGPVKDHLEKLTSIELSDKVFDITVSRYEAGNHLLCHNDDVKDSVGRHGRALAYVYYLNSRPWTKEDGGALVLYESDSHGEPVKINNRLFPQPNTLVVFETTETSWHAVEEVYCSDDVRLSINGWFYRSSKQSKILKAQKTIEPCLYQFLKPIIVDERIENFFKECLNQQYLMDKTCYMVRKTFKKRSEISLPDFLIKEKYDEICSALREAASDKKNLEHIGPYNKRNYHRMKIDKLPSICKDLYDAFRSELFFMLLARLTGLDLQPPSITSGSKGNGSAEDDDDEESDDDDDDDTDDDDDSDEDGEDEHNEDDDDDEDEEEEDEDYVVQCDSRGIGLVSRKDKGIAGDSSAKKSHPQVGAAGTSKEAPDTQGSVGSSSGGNSEEPVTIFDSTNGPVRKRKRKSDPFARLEFRQLDSGSYTLIHDLGYELGESSALDVILHFNHDFAVNFDDGGYICYIDGAPEEDLHDMDYELLSLEPKSNCLSLVYRCDQTTCRFMKHISKSHKGNYQDLYCVYYEKPDDIPDDPTNSKMKLK